MRRHFFIIALSLGVITSSCQESTPASMEVEDHSAEVISAQFTYLALGDSYTIGESVPEEERFPMQLAALLNQKDYKVEKPLIIARTGWTTDELQAAIDDAYLQDTTFNLVTLLIGVNNQYRGYPLETYKVEFESLLKQAIKFANDDPDKVFVLSIPDYGVTPFGQQKGEEQVGKEIDQFNAANAAISANYQVHYIDITPISRLAKTDQTLIAPDKLHPSGKMYQAWVGKLLPIVEQALK